MILHRSVSSCHSSVAALSTNVKSSASLFELSLPLLCQVFFFSFTAAPTASSSAGTSFHLPFGFACSQASWELCHPLLRAGCCHPVFVFPWQSLLCHFSLFSVVAPSRTSVVFLTLDNLFLVWCEGEDEMENLCIVSELKDAASSDG